MANRKPMPPFIDRHKDLGPLHDLLLKATVPDPKTGKKSITVLTDYLGFTRALGFLWIKSNRITPIHAKDIVDIHTAYAERVGLPKRERVKIEDFFPYIFVPTGNRGRPRKRRGLDII